VRPHIDNQLVNPFEPYKTIYHSGIFVFHTITFLVNRRWMESRSPTRPKVENQDIGAGRPTCGGVGFRHLRSK
jgi:hypothetical protein